jgi:hypothetical protein
MNQSDDASGRYENIVTCSDEAYGMLLLEDKSVLWREVLKRRRNSSTGDGTIPLGTKKEISIRDQYGDKYTLYSGGGILSPNVKKGWSVRGVERYNYYYELIEEFCDTEEGKTAMCRQRSIWNKSPLFPNKKRRLEDVTAEEEGNQTSRIKIRCKQAAWV